MNFKQRTFAIGIFCLAFCWCADRAVASPLCVSNSSDLEADLVNWYAIPSGVNEIRLVQKTYQLDKSLTLSSLTGNSLILRGGYDATCENETVAPANTIIDGGGLYGINLSSNNNVLVEGLTFAHLTGFHLEGSLTELRCNCGMTFFMTFGSVRPRTCQVYG
jgi:hypothetical protein